jgi:hypothetical protein
METEPSVKLNCFPRNVLLIIANCNQANRVCRHRTQCDVFKENPSNGSQNTTVNVHCSPYTVPFIFGRRQQIDAICRQCAWIVTCGI